MPSYLKSEKFRQKVITFSVILHCENVNFSDVSQKIDKYSDKFVTLLQNILEGEMKTQRGTMNMGPNHSQNATSQCKNRHIEILKKLNINDEDSSLSDMEDDILKTCQVTVNKEMTEKRVEKIEKKNRRKSNRKKSKNTKNR